MPSANLPAVIRSPVLTFKSVPFNAGSEHAQLLDWLNKYTSATERKYDESNEWLRVIYLQRYACLIYGSSRSSPKPGQKVAVVA